MDLLTGNAPISGASADGFLGWIRRFGPRNCNDWLIVPVLYAIEVQDGNLLDRDKLELAPASHMLAAVAGYSTNFLLVLLPLVR